MRKQLIAITAAALLGACAGTNFDFESARRVKLGMTEAELTGIMGAPYSVVSRGDTQIWVWSRATGFGGAKSVSYSLRDGKVIAVPTIPDSFK